MSTETARCDNCRRIYPTDELPEPRRLSERLDTDGPIPAGECPSCGALAYPESAGQRAIRELAEATGYSDGSADDETGVDALIAYKDSLEDRLVPMIDGDAAGLDRLARLLNGFAEDGEEWDHAEICNELVKVLRECGRSVTLVDD